MVKWTETALLNLQNIYDYIAIDSIYYAKNVVNNMVLFIEQLPFFPKKGRIIPELYRKEIREVILYSYRIIYKIRPKDILILRILHHRQNRKILRFIKF